MSEWRTVRLADVAKVGAGNSAPQNKALFDGGSYPFFRTADVGRVRVGELVTAQDHLNEQGIKGLKLHRSGTVLIPKSGASTFLDHRVIMTVDGYVSSHLATLYANEALMDRRYLFWVMQTISARDVSTDTSYPTLSLGQINDIAIPLPPLEEQRRIVAVLDEAFAAIATATANAEKNLANARELLQVATISRIHLKEDGWTEKPLGSFCNIYQPETISKKQMSDDGQYPVFGANGKIGRYDRFNHEQSQLLVTCRGATCGSINISEPFSWITGNAMVVRPRNGELRLGLLRRIFETGFDFSKVITGAAQPQITRQSLAPSKVAFPTDLGEQARLETELDEIDAEVRALEASYEAKLRELAELKQSLLHRAFSGGLAEREALAA